MLDFTGDEMVEVLATLDGDLHVLHPFNGSLITQYNPDETDIFPAAMHSWFLPIHINKDDQLDLVIIGTGGWDEPHDGERLIWGVDGKTREIVWRASLGDEVPHMWPQIPKPGDVDGDGDNEVIPTEGDGLYVLYPGVFKPSYPHVLVLDPETGHFLWEQWLPNSVAYGFTAAGVDGNGDDEVITAARTLLAVWDPTLEEHGDRLVREGGGFDGQFFSCIIPG